MTLPAGLNLDVSIDCDLWQAGLPNYQTIITSCCELVCKNVSEGKLLDKFSQIELSIVLCDDDFICKLNQDFRNKDTATNVLSFCGLDPDEIDTYLRGDADVPARPFSLGEAYISFETTNKEAEMAGITLNEHFSHLVLHGILHLLGYDHIEDVEAEVMEALEIKLLAILGIDDPYAA